MTTVAFAFDADVVRVTGADRVDLLHRLSSNDLLALGEGSAVRSTLFTTNQGKLIDWVWVVARADELLLQCAAGRGERVRDWIDKFTIMEDVHSEVAEDWSAVVVDGPAAAQLLKGGSPVGQGVVEGDEGVWFRDWPAYGDRLVGLLPGGAAQSVLMRARAAGIADADAATREVLRLRAGVPSAQHEYAEEVNPLELRLAAVAVSFDKGCYIGQEVISRLDSYDKVARYLMGFETEGEVAMDPELRILRDGSKVGRVTSLAPVPGGGTVGLAVVKREAAEAGAAHLSDGTSLELKQRPFWAER